tara:strand:+ start:746 stop:1237 length:492 start_codon:yes stop_codon:yes gene_type:complete
MLLTEEEINAIVLEETLLYLNEIKGSMSPRDFEKFLKYVPFTKAHRKAMSKSQDDLKDLDIYELVMGGKGPGFSGQRLDDWPKSMRDRLLIANWFVRNVEGVVNPDMIVDTETGRTKLRWPLVQRFVSQKFSREPVVKQVRKQALGIKEIIKEEVIKYLKENE